jgi:hypothetical protein
MSVVFSGFLYQENQPRHDKTEILLKVALNTIQQAKTMLGLTRSRLEPTIYCNQGEHAIPYTTDSVHHGEKPYNKLNQINIINNNNSPQGESVHSSIWSSDK